MHRAINDVDEPGLKAEIDEIMRTVDAVMKRIESVLPSPQQNQQEPVEP
jgi:hypothetical protein